jgi:two-component system LytT family response regulator
LDHVRADLSGVHVVQPNGESFTDLTLKVIEERTPLVRCHRQYLVNVDCIDEIRLLEHGLGEIKSKAGHLLPVSRRYLKSLKDLLGF